jgi:hypothetical protein
LSKLSTFLHPHHYHLYSLKHSLVQLYGYQQGYQINQLSDQKLERKAGTCQHLHSIDRGSYVDSTSEIEILYP